MMSRTLSTNSGQTFLWKLLPQPERSERVSSAKTFQHVRMKPGRIFSLQCHGWPRASDCRGELLTIDAVCEELWGEKSLQYHERRPGERTGCSDSALNYSLPLQIFTLARAARSRRQFFHRWQTDNGGWKWPLMGHYVAVSWASP